MITDLSILLPSYNNVCLPFVKELQRQANATSGLHYEIIVADDGSTDQEALETNRAISLYEHCHFIACEENRGRACIRNFLAQQAQGEWLLFIDSNMKMVHDNYISVYHQAMKCANAAPVIYGGYTIPDTDDGSLRYTMERRNPQNGDHLLRQGHAYQHFHTANFLVRREVMLHHPFDERFRFYGYEDVLWGKVLLQHDIDIYHIDNPLQFDDFQSNADFLRKTTEAMHTLYHFRKELSGYSSLLALSQRIHALHLSPWIARGFSFFRESALKRLKQPNAPLWLFQLYRIGYMADLFDKNNTNHTSR